MSKRIFDLAKKNYPTLWNKEMLDKLLELGRLTQEEYNDIIGENE
mgnify:FL=1